MSDQKGITEDIDNEWMRQKEIIQKIIDAGGFGPYAGNIQNISDAFNADSTLRCIDEGTVDGLHAAGSGIGFVLTEGLNKDKEGYEAIEAGVTAAAEAFRDSGLKTISSHEECGAAKLVYDQFSDEFKKLLKSDHNISSPDQFGEYFSKLLALELNIEYSGRININDMFRPSGNHITRVSYIDLTGRFNPAAVEDLPPGFVISRKYLGADQTLEEARISVDIAAGEHGFDTRINENNLHYIVIVMDSYEKQNSIDNLSKELKPLIEKYGNKIKIDGFIEPNSR